MEDAGVCDALDTVSQVSRAQRALCTIDRTRDRRLTLVDIREFPVGFMVDSLGF